jgi:hypothetical protein
MKRLGIVAMNHTYLSYLRKTTHYLEPNFFELQGCNTWITYSTTSQMGVPHFSYSQPDQYRTFSGSDLQLEDTEMGRMVTVLLKDNQDREGFESLSLLLPTVYLVSQSQSFPIQTLAISRRRSPYVNLAIPTQIQTYDVLHLFGTAKRVTFYND